MNYEQIFRKLYNFPGWVMERINASETSVIIKLHFDKRRILRCPYCSHKSALNKTSWQTARDLPLGDVKNVLIQYEACQGRCSNCKNYFTILPEGIYKNAKATQRLMNYVCRLCRFMPANQVPNFIPVSVSTAIRWDKKVLIKQLPEPNYDKLKIIIVDEKSIGKHHHYLTVVINGITGEVLHLEEGKKKAALISFFNKLTSKQRENIIAVAMDRGGSYKAAVKEYLPKAAIVFDKYHLIANYNKVIDQVRRIEFNKASETDREFIKGERYNLYKRPENRTSEQQQRLDVLFEKNKPLFQTDYLKDGLQYLWTYKYTKCADKYLDIFIGWAKETAIEPVIKFAEGLNRDRKEILNFIKYRITSAKIEAFNNVISRIIHRACGYKDLEYLFLKIRQEGLRGAPQT